MELEGRVAIVTGGGSGIGRSVALGLADRGVDIVIVDVNGDAANESARLVEERGRRACAATADVSDKAQVQDAVQRAQNEFGRVDILVNNAGIGSGVRIIDLEEELWDRVVNIHLKGTFLFSQAVLPGMMERRHGRIVNIISRAAFKGRAGAGPYAAGKGGVLALSRVIAQEVGEYGITVNNVAPGATDTPMVRRGMVTEEALMAEAVRSGVIIAPVRLARADEIAGAVLYFCSSAADHITGTTIHVNGGSYMP